MDLAQRIEQLERRQRRTARALLLAGMIVAAGIGAKKSQAAKPVDSIDVKMIKLWDDQGNLRGFLGTTPKGNASLSLADASGNLCLVLGVTNAANPSMELNDAKSTMRARLTLTDDGSPHLLFYDAQGKVTRHEE